MDFRHAQQPRAAHRRREQEQPLRRSDPRASRTPVIGQPDRPERRMQSRPRQRHASCKTAFAIRRKSSSIRKAICSWSTAPGKAAATAMRACCSSTKHRCRRCPRRSWRRSSGGPLPPRVYGKDSFTTNSARRVMVDLFQSAVLAAIHRVPARHQQHDHDGRLRIPTRSTTASSSTAIRCRRKPGASDPPASCRTA